MLLFWSVGLCVLILGLLVIKNFFSLLFLVVLEM